MKTADGLAQYLESRKAEVEAALDDPAYLVQVAEFYLQQHPYQYFCPEVPYSSNTRWVSLCFLALTRLTEMFLLV